MCQCAKDHQNRFKLLENSDNCQHFPPVRPNTNWVDTVELKFLMNQLANMSVNKQIMSVITDKSVG